MKQRRPDGRTTAGEIMLSYTGMGTVRKASVFISFECILFNDHCTDHESSLPGIIVDLHAVTVDMIAYRDTM